MNIEQRTFNVEHRTQETAPIPFGPDHRLTVVVELAGVRGDWADSPDV